MREVSAAGNPGSSIDPDGSAFVRGIVVPVAVEPAPEAVARLHLLDSLAALPLIPHSAELALDLPSRLVGVGYTLWLSWSDERIRTFEWHFQPLPVAVQRVGTGGRATGAFIMGAMSGLVAAPCRLSATAVSSPGKRRRRISSDLRKAGAIAGDDGTTTRHRFKRCNTQALLLTRDEHRGRSAINIHEFFIGDRAMKSDIAGKSPPLLFTTVP